MGPFLSNVLPTAAATNCLRFRGLKHLSDLALQVARNPTGSHRAKTKLWISKAVSHWRLWGHLFLSLLQRLRPPESLVGCSCFLPFLPISLGVSSPSLFPHDYTGLGQKCKLPSHLNLSPTDLLPMPCWAVWHSHRHRHGTPWGITTLPKHRH